MNLKKAAILLSGSLLMTLSGAVVHAAVDEADAQKLLKDSQCGKCHDVVKAKKGKSYKKTAAEYKGKPDAVAQIIKHISEPKEVEVEGEKVEHGTVKTRDAARIKNLAEWILSR
ncbi:MAG: class I cytochrome c [Rhodocyclaceae bacterium]|nr:class I cytochrome c [Rhodocyclaceae bacterium]MDP3036152.1 class I cytochrome c [Rhodocyclaceae bacterium]